MVFSKATGWELQFEEGGNEYKERIEVDVAKNTETIDVPAHNGLNHSVVLNDFNVVSYSILYLFTICKALINMLHV